MKRAIIPLFCFASFLFFCFAVYKATSTQHKSGSAPVPSPVVQKSPLQDPIISALKDGDLATFSQLLSQEGPYQEAYFGGAMGSPLLHLAVVDNNIEKLKAVFASGSPVDVQNTCML